MVKFLKVIDDLIIAILGKSCGKRSGEDRRVKKPRKRSSREKIGW